MRSFVLLLLLALLSGCAPSPRVTVNPGFKPVPEQDLVYIVPFQNTLVPDDITTQIFDDFVDLLNEGREQAGVQRFFILKDDLKDIDQKWLSRQVYVSGELWSYIQSSGCCSTEIRLKSRAYVHEPAKATPTAEIFYPAERFFEHEKSTLQIEQQKLTTEVARELASRILTTLSRK